MLDLTGIDIKVLSDRVIRGDFGDGEERKKNLGAFYDEVQKRVNEMLQPMPCPFCGNDGIWVEDIDVRGEDRFYAVCPRCGAKSGNQKTPVEAIVKWNTQTRRTCHMRFNDATFMFYSGEEVLPPRFECSECGASSPGVCVAKGEFLMPHYCPSCGAKVVRHTESKSKLS